MITFTFRYSDTSRPNTGTKPEEAESQGGRDPRAGGV